jgi:hypothetical protein
MTRYKVTLEGITPLLMNKAPLPGSNKSNTMQPQAAAEQAAYRMNISGNRNLCIPVANLQACLLAASAFYEKQSDEHITLARAVAAGVTVIASLDLGTASFVLDSQTVKIGATTRGQRYRPRIDNWKGTTVIQVDGITLEELEGILNDAGRLVGLMEKRPEKLKGSNGQFRVVNIILA